MTLALAVIPYLDRGLVRESLRSLRTTEIVPMPWDNTRHNHGVTAAWAAGAYEVLAGTADWLIVWSTAIVFGQTGGRDFARALDQPECYPDCDVPVLISGIGCGWHLTAIHRDVLTIVGTFDAHAFFAYYEDNDWIYRHTLAGLGDLWRDGHTQVPVDLAVNRGDAHSIHRGLVSVDFGLAEQAYIDKWGGRPRSERFTHPYNNPALDWRYTGPQPGETT